MNDKPTPTRGTRKVAMIGAVMSAVTGRSADPWRPAFHNVPAQDQPTRRVHDRHPGSGEAARRLRARERVQENRNRKIRARVRESIANFDRFRRDNQRTVIQTKQLAAHLDGMSRLMPEMYGDIYSIDHPEFGKLYPEITDRKQRKLLFYATLYGYQGGIPSSQS